MRWPRAIVVLGVLFALLGISACAPATPRLKPGTGMIDVPGGRVWYQIVGSGPGTPLLLLHGGPGVPSYYLRPMGALGDDRPVIFYDQLGCGRSEHPTDSTLWTRERFVAEVAAVRKQLGLSEVGILGHSWGTMLAVDYMLTKPEGVRCLVLSSPVLSTPLYERGADSLRHLLPDTTLQKIVRHEQDGSYDSPEYQSALNEFYGRFVARRLPLGPDLDSSFAQLAVPIYGYMEGPSEFTITGTLKDYDETARLHEIATPTLFTAGEFDEVLPSSAEHYRSLMPHAEMAIIANSGHLTMHDEPERYIGAVREFLRRQDAAGK